MRPTSLRRADKTLSTMLAAARESGYFGVQCDREHRELRLDDRHLRLGRVLMENVRNKWHKDSSAANVVSLNELGLSARKQSVLDVPEAKLKEMFEKIEKSTDCTVLPFTLREEFSKRLPTEETSDGDDERLKVRGKESTKLSQMLFTGESQAECFMTVQRLRKIWWMKISANPGRIFASDVQINDNIHYTSLFSKFRFGNVEMEKIECLSGAAVLGERFPTIIRSTVSLESAALSLVLDGIDAAVENELCLDRAIAPFQCSVLCLHSAAADSSSSSNLLDLAKYVRMLISRAGISTYMSEKDYCTNETAQNRRIEHFDRIGIPYVLLIGAECLEQGFLRLRNRDTTISETIHLSDVPNYLLDIFASD